MSNRIRLRPHERAREDQVLAEVRELGRDGRTATLVTTYATSAQQCSWCDCPDDPTGPHATVPDYVCSSICHEHAQYLNITDHGQPFERRYPVCGGHQQDFIRFMAARVRDSGAPIEIEHRPIRDEDR